jgi:hypothetical protein
MTIEGFEVLFYTLTFLVPGFVFHAVVSAFVPRRVEQEKITLLKFLTVSFVNYGFWFWLIYLMFKGKFFPEQLWVNILVWIAIIVISPLIGGVIWGVFHQKGWILKLLGKMGFRLIDQIPTAWDDKFSKIEKALWLIVFLKDGSKVAGWFGKKSFASDGWSNRDLYIEEIYDIKEDGRWKATESPNEGVLITGDQIKYIEFWPDEAEEEKNGET